MSAPPGPAVGSRDERAGAAAPGGRAGRLTAGALLLTPLSLALPGSAALLAGDPLAELTGAGWAALLALPLATVLVLSRAAPRAPLGTLLLGGFLAAGALSLGAFPPVDTLAADRALCLAAASLAAFLGGASLDDAGRLLFARGLALAALFAAAGALLLPGPGGAIAGPLQNTGATAELALPGAVAGAFLFARDRSPGGAPWRWLGAAAVLALALFAGRAPVLAAVVALAALLPLGVAFAPARGDRRRLAALGGLALAALLTGWFARPDGAPGPRTDTGEPAVDHLAGVDVRLAIWERSLAVARDRPLFGVGPGQFAAAFPPYRDPAERRASDAAYGLGPETAGAGSEVEHAHNDWLQGALEVGLAGGALWILFLVAAAVRAAGALHGPPVPAALGAAALAVLVNALARAPLLSNPAAAPVGFALLGIALARPPSRARRGGAGAEPPRSLAGRAAVFTAAVLLALAAGEARSLVSHGRAMARLVSRGGTATGARLLDALAARPDSPEALSVAARAAEAAGPAAALAAWEAVLERRPFRLEALVQAAKADAQLGRLEDARRRWRYALALAPGDAGVLNNLMRAAAFAGEIEEALAWHAEAGFEPDRLAVLGFALLQEAADVDGARQLFARADARYRGLSTQGAHDLAAVLEDEGQPDRARVLRGYAQLVWARQHAAQGDAGSAVRSYRQALAGLGMPTPDGPRAPARTRYELAAALVLAGRPDEARAELPPPPHDARLLRDLPAWAGEALLPLLAPGTGSGPRRGAETAPTGG